ncbi:hypothetical protein BN126310027 [Stenotrophomonas thermophila]|nr:hypothetical protein BN126310027 [Stenotrophomonas maltophilia]
MSPGRLTVAGEPGGNVNTGVTPP